jgi:putative transposase
MSAGIRRRRLPHLYIPGHTHFLTFRLAKSQPAPLDESEKDQVLLHLHRMAPGILQAYVVMPDHVHLLYQSTGVEDLRLTLKGLKGASARSLHLMFGRKPPIWQDESYDHVVRDEHELQETWRYIEANPMRRGLVENPRTYPWSSACARIGCDPGLAQEGRQECLPHKSESKPGG